MNPIRLALAGLVALAVAAPLTAGAAKIPAHPDKLKFPKQDFSPPSARDHRVELKNGVVAYLVPDTGLPLVTIQALMRVGPDLDPAGKEGMAYGVMHLLTRSGTKTKTAKELEDRVAFLGAQLDSRMGPGGGGIFGLGAAPITESESRATINLLSKDLDEGLAILVECLQSPAFEQERIDLAREQLLQAMKQRNDDSQDIEEREWGFLIRGNDHWTNRYATKASIESITRDDLMGFHQKYVGPKNFILTVSGDFDRDAIVAKLEAAFSGWSNAGTNPGPPAAPAADPVAGWYMVEKDVNQGRVSIGLRGPDRYDADYQAYRVMNVILGAGGFSSRLVNSIRSDEGLAYSVNSQLIGGHYYPDEWRIRFQSKVRSVARALELAMKEVDRIAKEDVTQEELTLAKNLLVESMPAFFETADAIAGVLGVEELTGRYQKDPEYFGSVRERIATVTVADVKRVAAELFDASNMVVLAVGNTSDMLEGDPKHEASIVQMAGGEPVRLPLRDPMTMQPMANP